MRSSRRRRSSPRSRAAGRLSASRAAAVRIRRLRGTDLAAVIAMDGAAVEHEHRLVPLMAPTSADQRLGRRWWAGFRRWRNTAVFVAADGSRLVGMLGVDLRRARNPRMPFKRSVYLHSMWVEPCARGHRVAQRLIRHALDWSRRHGAGRATLETAANNDAARALYGRFGFAVQEVTMARRLRQSA